MASSSQRTGGGRWGMRANVLRQGDAHDGSRVGYVELFFDLVFVFAITQLSHGLIAHPDLTTLLHTLVLGWAVWWLWIDTTWVTNWLDPEKVPVRTMLLVLMLLGLLMSSAIPEAFDGKALLFAVPFVLIQVGRTLFTVWAMGRHWPENAVNFVRITVWVSVSGAFWIAGALADDTTRLALWAVAALLDAAGPRALFWVPGMGPTDPTTWAVRGSHMAERVSLFLILSLGESIIVTGTAFAELELDATTLLAFLAAFASTVLMWLLFFDRSEHSATAYLSSRADPGMVAQTAYTYVPFLLIAGIVLTAVADELVLLHPVGHTDTWTAGLICGAAAVYLLGNAFFRRATGGRWSAAHLAGVVLVLALFGLRDALTPLGLNWLSNGVLLAVIVGDVVRARTQQQPEP
ncbi:low temperature requirement protein A [Cellulomonas fengjieae]|uniref:low temperature requirement protein A n=1 Tax=Cellulomonas fengjieae TaxID=2819978 RepID=UPI001AAF01FB|nr:low temperature requirement protein A [Cellulomonas fengjieae]MBO3100903.1 low temperature requirement protein A [Cellulomonas fengjieae]